METRLLSVFPWHRPHCHLCVLLQVRDQLAQEQSSLAEEIRQEFTERLMGTEEENKQLKAEMAEMRARQRLELERVAREKEQELEEVHRR